MEEPKKIPVSLRKSELADMLGMSPQALKKLMNVTHKKELEEAGYTNKFCITVPNKVVRKIFDIYGSPFTTDDF